MRSVVAALVAVLLLAGVVADHIELGYYVLTPGLAQPVGPLVRVPPARAHRVDGQVLLTDVYVTQVTALSYLYDKLRANAQVLPAATVLGPAAPPSQLAAQGYLEMAESQEAAKAAALTRLGYRVGVHAAGTLIFAVTSRSPAAGRLHVGEVVTQVDGRATPDLCAFSQAIADRGPGQAVGLSVERSTVTARAAFVPGPVVSEQFTLSRWPTSVPRPTPTPSCRGGAGSSGGYLGVEVETQEVYSYPFAVTIRTTSIGGPSAGLAMTLGIIDSLSGGHLTGGRTVAATGTIDPTGTVGEVGGIPEKTIAVERGGATVFFVPATQVATARAKATPTLRVYGVRSLTQVLDTLRKLGGTVPPMAARGS